MEPPKDTADKLVVPGRSMFMKEQNIGQQSSERGKEFENCMNIKVRKEGRGEKIVQALEQILPCSQQKCLQSHRFILKELQPMRRTLAGREENCEEEGAAESRH